MKNLYFIRHGETVWNTEKRLQGQLDSPLTETGIQQIQSLLVELDRLSIHKIFTSPLGRAQSSAKIISEHLKLPFEIVDDLKERHFGDWQGVLFDQLKSKEEFSSILLEVNKNKPKGGESGLNCAKRMHQYLISQIERKSFHNILIMTHGEILRCFFSQLYPLNEYDNQQINADAYSQYRNGNIFKVSYSHKDKIFYLK